MRESRKSKGSENDQTPRKNAGKGLDMQILFLLEKKTDGTHDKSSKM